MKFSFMGISAAQNENVFVVVVVCMTLTHDGIVAIMLSHCPKIAILFGRDQSESLQRMVRHVFGVKCNNHCTTTIKQLNRH